ncbi:MAG: hypothetical protein LBU81_01040 [Methanosarcinales archaeon]|nr:hypothetical protein [Methanosarcinales archaeon]
MKKENKIRVFYVILSLLSVTHYLYTPADISIGLAIFPALIMYIALLPAKNKRDPDYSTALNIIGILFAVLAYIIYFAHSLKIEIWQINDTIETVCLLIFMIYALFLGWYKGTL